METYEKGRPALKVTVYEHTTLLYLLCHISWNLRIGVPKIEMYNILCLIQNNNTKLSIIGSYSFHSFWIFQIVTFKEIVATVYRTISYKFSYKFLPKMYNI